MSEITVTALSEAEYRAYMAAFNDRDLLGFARFYADDIVFVLGERAPMHGRAAIIAWYERAWSKIEEHCEVADLIVGEHGLAAELHTTFTAIEDWPDYGPRPLLKGEVIKRIGFVHYKIRDGRFTQVKTALHRLVAAPWLPALHA